MHFAAGRGLAGRASQIDRVWYVTAGTGQVWRKLGDREEVVDAGPGTCLTIPTGAHFQFRNIGRGPFSFIMATMPPWPGMDEAVAVENHWPIG